MGCYARIKSNIAWNEELEKELYRPEEIAENNLQAQLICELIEVRQEKGISQQELEMSRGVTQSAIARVERGTSSPTLETLFKVLLPLGKTLAIVPIRSES